MVEGLREPDGFVLVVESSDQDSALVVYVVGMNRRITAATEHPYNTLPGGAPINIELDTGTVFVYRGSGQMAASMPPLIRPSRIWRSRSLGLTISQYHRSESPLERTVGGDH